MKSNIIVVGLNYDFSKCVAKELSNFFDMFFLDANDLIEYSLIDAKNMQLICGIEYYEKEKRKIIVGINQYENTIVNIPHNILLEGDTILKLRQNAIIIYLEISKSLIEKEQSKNGNFTTETIAYKELNFLLKQKADVSIDCATLSVKSTLEKVILKLREL